MAILDNEEVSPEEASRIITNLKGVQSSASEIDNNINVEAFNTLVSSTSSSIFKKSISLLGDSLGVGYYATNEIGYAQIFKRILNSELNLNNFGLNCGNLGYSEGTSSVFVNGDATLSLTGRYIDIPNGETIVYTENEDSDFIFENMKLRLLSLESETGKNLTINFKDFAGTIINTQIATLGSRLSDELSIPAKSKRIEVQNNIEGDVVSFECFYIYEKEEDFKLINLSQSGKALEDITTDTIDVWFDGVEYAIMALNTNDSTYSTFKTKIDYIINKYNSQNYTKLVIVDLDIRKAYDNEIRQELRRLNTSCKGSIYLPIRELLTSNKTSAIDTELLALNAINADLLHYSDSAHEFIANTIAKSIGLINNSKSINKLEELSQSVQALTTSGNLVSNDWYANTTLVEGSSSVISLLSGGMTINSATDEIVYKTEARSGTFRYDFSNLSTSEKDDFYFYSASVKLVGASSNERVGISLPMKFEGKRVPTPCYYKNSVWVHVNKEVELYIIIPFMDFQDAFGNYYLNGTEYRRFTNITLSEGWHKLEAISYDSSLMDSVVLSKYLDKFLMCSFNLKTSGDVEFIFNEPIIEVGDNLKGLVKKA